MNPEIDPTLVSSPASVGATLQQSQQPMPAAEAAGSGMQDVAEVVVDVATEGIFDAVSGIFSIFD